jgi:hypothetical protein
MPKQKQGQNADEPGQDMPDSEKARIHRSEARTRHSQESHGDGHERHGIPRWRKIEIMRERAQLREALGGVDLFDEFDDFEEEVFGSDEEYEVLYRHSDDDEEDEEIEFEDDDFEDDDFEEAEED